MTDEANHNRIAGVETADSGAHYRIESEGRRLHDGVRQDFVAVEIRIPGIASIDRRKLELIKTNDVGTTAGLRSPEGDGHIDIPIGSGTAHGHQCQIGNHIPTLEIRTFK